MPLVALLAVALPVAMATAAGGTTRYVAPGGSNTGNECTEAAAPCATIQHAVDIAAAGDTIEVGAGTYAEHVTVDKALVLRGPNAGVDPNDESRGAEAILDGGGGTALTPDAAGIRIDGFTVSALDTGFPIYTGTDDTDRLEIANDIVGSGVRAITIATGGEAIAIEDDLIEGKGYGVSLAKGSYRDLKIDDNVFPGPVDYYTLFNTGESSFEGLELRGNTVRDTVNLAGSVVGGVVSGNVFDVESPGDMGLQIDLHESLVSGNSFEGHGNTACLQLFGSQYGLEPSEDAVVSENSFRDCDPYGIQLSPDMDRITIARNTILDSGDGVNTRDVTPWDVDDGEIRILANRIVDSAHAGVANSVEGVLDARDNWWGCNEGPTTDRSDACDTISAGVDASRWLRLTAAAEPGSILTGQSTMIGAELGAGSGAPAPPDGTPIVFSTDLGSLSPMGTTLTSGTASAVLSSDLAGLATVGVTVDQQAVPVPVEVEAPSPRAAATTPPAPSRLILPVEGSPLPVSSNGQVTIGVVSCPADCRVAVQVRRVKVGSRSFGVVLHTRKWLAGGQRAAISAVLPGKALRALRSRDRGRAIIGLRIWSATVKAVNANLLLESRAGRSRPHS